MSDNRIKGLSIVLFFTCALFFLSSAVHVNSLPSPSSSSRLLPEAVENNNGAPEKGGYYSLFPSSLTSWLPGFLRERRTDNMENINNLIGQMMSILTELKEKVKENEENVAGKHSKSTAPTSNGEEEKDDPNSTSGHKESSTASFDIWLDKGFNTGTLSTPVRHFMSQSKSHLSQAVAKSIKLFSGTVTVTPGEKKTVRKMINKLQSKEVPNVKKGAKTAKNPNRDLKMLQMAASIAFKDNSLRKEVLKTFNEEHHEKKKAEKKSEQFRKQLVTIHLDDKSQYEKFATVLRDMMYWRMVAEMDCCKSTEE
eukprot:Nk52_evm6s317 gene=Nk52_evmTU6s317